MIEQIQPFAGSAQVDCAPGPFPFVCHGATVHFIYSFILKDTDSWVLTTKDLLTRLSKGEKGAAIIGRPECRSSITPYLSLLQDEVYIKGPESKGKLGDRAVVLDRLVRLFPAAGTCTFALSLAKGDGRAIGVDDILALQRAIDPSLVDKAPAAPLHLGSEQTGLTQPTTLCRLFAWVVGEIAGTDGSGLAWRDKKYFDEHAAEPQTPWVVTVLEVDGAVEQAFCSSFSEEPKPLAAKTRNMAKYLRDVMRILYRPVGAGDVGLDPEPAVLAGCANINIDARVFVLLARRSILVICPRVDKDPARYLLPDLLDVCEVVRARWHSLIILNRMLDDSTRELIELAKSRGGSPRALAGEILKLRACFAAGLQDPGVYRTSGEALSRIYENMLESHHVGELSKLVDEKLRLVDQMLADILQLGWMQSREQAGV